MANRTGGQAMKDVYLAATETASEAPDGDDAVKSAATATAAGGAGGRRWFASHEINLVKSNILHIDGRQLLRSGIVELHPEPLAVLGAAGVQMVPHTDAHLERMSAYLRELIATLYFFGGKGGTGGGGGSGGAAASCSGGAAFGGVSARSSRAAAFGGVSAPSSGAAASGGVSAPSSGAAAFGGVSAGDMSSTIWARVGWAFKVQPDNIYNQFEDVTHVLLTMCLREIAALSGRGVCEAPAAALPASLGPRLIALVTEEYHAKLFDNYLKWCDFIGVSGFPWAGGELLEELRGGGGSGGSGGGRACEAAAAAAAGANSAAAGANSAAADADSAAVAAGATLGDPSPAGAARGGASPPPPSARLPYDPGPDGETLTMRQLVVEIVLFRLLWGEAANLRHTPELLAFLFHWALNAWATRGAKAFSKLGSLNTPLRKGAEKSGEIGDKSEGDESVFCDVRDAPGAGGAGCAATAVVAAAAPLAPSSTILDVITEFCQAIRDEATFGASLLRPPDHDRKLNYDDFNELFWNRAPLAWVGATAETAPAPASQLSRSAVRDLLARLRGTERAGCGASAKTFVERRGFLQVAIAFFRVFHFHVLLFQALLLARAYYTKKLHEDRERIEGGLVISLVLASALLPCAEIVNSYRTQGARDRAPGFAAFFSPGGALSPRGLFILLRQNFVHAIRLALGVALLVILLFRGPGSPALHPLTGHLASAWLGLAYLAFYLMHATWPYLFLRVGGRMPLFSLIWRLPGVRRVLGPTTYAGGTALLAEDAKHVLAYCAFWTVPLACKAAFWFFGVLPVTEVSAPFLAHLEPRPVIAADVAIVIDPSNIVLRALFWAPFAILFFYDTQLFFLLWSSLVATLVGYTRRVGYLKSADQIRTQLIPQAPTGCLVRGTGGSDAASPGGRRRRHDGGVVEIADTGTAAEKAELMGGLGEEPQEQALAAGGPLHRTWSAASGMQTPHPNPAVAYANRRDPFELLKPQNAPINSHELRRTKIFAFIWNEAVFSWRCEDVISNQELQRLMFSELPSFAHSAPHDSASHSYLSPSTPWEDFAIESDTPQRSIARVQWTRSTVRVPVHSYSDLIDSFAQACANYQLLLSGDATALRSRESMASRFFRHHFAVSSVRSGPGPSAQLTYQALTEVWEAFALFLSRYCSAAGAELIRSLEAAYEFLCEEGARLMFFDLGAVPDLQKALVRLFESGERGAGESAPVSPVLGALARLLGGALGALGGVDVRPAPVRRAAKAVAALAAALPSLAPPPAAAAAPALDFAEVDALKVRIEAANRELLSPGGSTLPELAAAAAPFVPSAPGGAAALRRGQIAQLRTSFRLECGAFLPRDTDNALRLFFRRALAVLNARGDGRLRCPEAARRMQFFANSLLMRMPLPPAVSEMVSVTTLTPYYREPCTVDLVHMHGTSESNGVTTEALLRTLMPAEFDNFVERVDTGRERFQKLQTLVARVDAREAELAPALAVLFEREARAGTAVHFLRFAAALQEWLALRSQVLWRTAQGMMHNQTALQILTFAETTDAARLHLAHDPNRLSAAQRAALAAPEAGLWHAQLAVPPPYAFAPAAKALARLKYQYVVAAQEFAADLDRQGDAAADLRANGLVALLRRHPNMRVATLGTGADGGRESVLYRWAEEEPPPAAAARVSPAAGQPAPLAAAGRPLRPEAPTALPPPPAAAAPASAAADRSSCVPAAPKSILTPSPAAPASAGAPAGSSAAGPLAPPFPTGARLAAFRGASQSPAAFSGQSTAPGTPLVVAAGGGATAAGDGAGGDASCGSAASAAASSSAPGGGRLQIVYRIKLPILIDPSTHKPWPRAPIIGPGKPENQNHAMVFTRGETVQAVDMNMAGYLEEALKLRSLLQEFTAHPRMRILGFREHVFSLDVSSISSFMALQELNFVTNSHRLFHTPLRVRMHYGHPDVFDRFFVATCGSVSKSSNGINLSEDVFAGYNVTQRGFGVHYVDYTQVGKGRDVGLQQIYVFEKKVAGGNAEQMLSRDVRRLMAGSDFARACSLFYTGCGFYLNCLVLMFAVMAWLYGKALLCLAREASPSAAALAPYWERALAPVTSLQLQLGLLLMLPIFFVTCLEKGGGRALRLFFAMVAKFALFYYNFMVCTKAAVVDSVLVYGGARYEATGRGFAIEHASLVQLWKSYYFTHFQISVEILLLLILYACFCRVSWTVYFFDTWSTFVFYFSFTLTPFIFNPHGLRYEQVRADFTAFRRWLFADDERDSWRAWWRAEMDFRAEPPWRNRALILVRLMRFPLLAFSLTRVAAARLARSDVDFFFWQLSVFGAFALLHLLAQDLRLVHPTATRWLAAAAAAAALLAAAAAAAALPPGNLAPLLLLPAASSLVLLWGGTRLAIVLAGRGAVRHRLVTSVMRAYSLAFAAIIALPVVAISAATTNFHQLQTRVLFNTRFVSVVEAGLTKRAELRKTGRL